MVLEKSHFFVHILTMGWFFTLDGRKTDNVKFLGAFKLHID